MGYSLSLATANHVLCPDTQIRHCFFVNSSRAQHSSFRAAYGKTVAKINEFPIAALAKRANGFSVNQQTNRKLFKGLIGKLSQPPAQVP